MIESQTCLEHVLKKHSDVELPCRWSRRWGWGVSTRSPLGPGAASERSGVGSRACNVDLVLRLRSEVLGLGYLLVTFLGAQLEDRGHRHLSPRLMLLVHCEEPHFAPPLLRAVVLPPYKGAHEQWSRFPETSKTAGDFMAS